MLLSPGRFFASNAAAIPPTPSFWHSLARGDRTASITVSTTATLGAGTINNLVDGGFTANSTDACWFNSGQSSRVVKFDFGTAKIINAFRWVQDVASSHGTWVFEGSNDDVTYTTLSASFTLGLAVAIGISWTNSTAYRYYQIRQTGGVTASAPWLLEIEFRIADSNGAARDSTETGDRTSFITVSTTATPSGGSNIHNLIDGSFGQSSVNSFVFTAGESSKVIKFDLGSGVTKIFTGFQWFQSTANSHGTWVFEGSNDDSSYTGIGSSFTLGGAAVTAFTAANTTAYRYYRLRQTSGTTSSTPWDMEVEFQAA